MMVNLLLVQRSILETVWNGWTFPIVNVRNFAESLIHRKKKSISRRLAAAPPKIFRHMERWEKYRRHICIATKSTDIAGGVATDQEFTNNWRKSFVAYFICQSINQVWFNDFLKSAIGRYPRYPSKDCLNKIFSYTGVFLSKKNSWAFFLSPIISHIQYIYF
jgi:hypothetical protein